MAIEQKLSKAALQIVRVWEETAYPGYHLFEPIIAVLGVLPVEIIFNRTKVTYLQFVVVVVLFLKKGKIRGATEPPHTLRELQPPSPGSHKVSEEVPRAPSPRWAQGACLPVLDFL